jgi:hypothetical protein
MSYYHSARIILSGGQAIVVDFGSIPDDVRREVCFMNSSQMYHFGRTGKISPEWMPLDHRVVVTADNPVARFHVSGSDAWIVVIERSTLPPPSIAIDDEPAAPKPLWITLSHGPDKNPGKAATDLDAF